MFRRGIVVLFAVLAIGSIANAVPIRVLVMPFEPIAPDASQNDLGEGVSTTISAELSADKRFYPIEPASSAPGDPHLGIAAAQALGQKSDASYVVFGSFHRLDEQVRLTGYVVNVSTGEIAGTLRATGDQSIWFSLQDSIASQVKRALPRPEIKSTDPTALPPVAPIAYSGPLRGSPVTTYTPEIWRPQNAQTRFASDYDRYYRRPGPNYPYWGWYGWGYSCYRPNYSWGYWSDYW